MDAFGQYAIFALLMRTSILWKGSKELFDTYCRNDNGWIWESSCSRVRATIYMCR